MANVMLKRRLDTRRGKVPLPVVATLALYGLAYEVMPGSSDHVHMTIKGQGEFQSFT